MRNDVRRRLPWYWSDWTDAWNYRVIPSTWVSFGGSYPSNSLQGLMGGQFIFFANVLPGIAFSLDLIVSLIESRSESFAKGFGLGNHGAIWCAGSIACIGV